ncbi:hypothetical protein VTN00DRAFT_9671 [Thermoascus crustaceus]|uniref:uncharacterized protein n=1 Tax=Thermoascus crustaceus TaxID=5088 RepID=UPI0037443F4B
MICSSPSFIDVSLSEGRKRSLLCKHFYESPNWLKAVRVLRLDILGPLFSPEEKLSCDPALFREIVKKASHSTEEQMKWETDLTAGLDDAWAGLLPLLLGSLRTLRVEYKDRSGYFSRIIQRAANLEKPFDVKPGFTRLEQVEIEPSGEEENEDCEEGDAYHISHVPCPLPTNAEIEEASLLIEHNGYKVVKVGSHFAVKFGSALQLDLIEGENMLFIQQATTKIRVTQVYALYNGPDTSTNYIVMEYIEGDTLDMDTQWPSLTYSQKLEISTTLREESISVSSASSHYKVSTAVLVTAISWTDTPANPIHVRPTRPTSIVARVFRGHEPKFTHADFQRKNVMIRRVGRDDNADGFQYEVTLIDWEKSGRHRRYWEYSMAMFTTRWDDDWDEWVVKILEPFDVEFPWLRMLYWDLWS